MSLTQYCLFINNHVGKAAGRMFNPPLWNLAYAYGCYYRLLRHRGRKAATFTLKAQNTTLHYTKNSHKIHTKVKNKSSQIRIYIGRKHIPYCLLGNICWLICVGQAKGRLVKLYKRTAEGECFLHSNMKIFIVNNCSNFQAVISLYKLSSVKVQASQPYINVGRQYVLTRCTADISLDCLQEQTCFWSCYWTDHRIIYTSDTSVIPLLHKNWRPTCQEIFHFCDPRN